MRRKTMSKGSISTRQVLAFMKGTVTDLGTKVESLSTKMDGRFDNLSSSVETLHKKFAVYEEHSKQCDKNFSECDQRFKRDYDRINQLTEKVGKVANGVVIEDKSEEKSKNKIAWIVGIATILIALTAFAWQGFKDKNELTKDELKSIVKEAMQQ